MQTAGCIRCPTACDESSGASGSDCDASNGGSGTDDGEAENDDDADNKININTALQSQRIQ